MKLVIQRVKSAHVTEKETARETGRIQGGVLVLVGVREGDSEANAVALAEKLAKMRIMSDAQEKMNVSVKESGARVLAVSQFTLYADTSKGNRPSFLQAGDPAVAQRIYDRFVARLRELGIPTEIGSFGNYMMIPTELDGPVTIILEE